MRRCTLATIVCIVWACTAQAGLVGHWKLDDGEGDMAAESSGTYIESAGSYLNGNLEGGPTWTGGLVGDCCLTFDGMDDSVIIPGFKGITGNHPRTITGWVKILDSTVPHDIISWGTNETGQKWRIAVNIPDHPYTLGCLVQGGNIFGTTNLCDGAWHHIAIVYDGSPNVTDVTLYVDGRIEQVGQSTPQTINTGNTYDVELGRYRGSSSWPLKGCLDDVRIYDIALDADRIAQMADAGGLVAHWRMDDAGDPDFHMNPEMVVDSQEGFNATRYNMGPLNWGHGRFGGGLSFGGTDEYLRVDGRYGRAFYGIEGATGERTVTAWIRTSVDGAIISWGDSGTGTQPGTGWNLEITGSKLKIGVWGGYRQGHTMVTDGKWHHVAVTALPARYGDPAYLEVGDLCLYVDGVQQQLTSIALDLALNTGDQDDNPVLVGVRYKMVDDLLAAHFLGQIDDIRVYNRALSPGVIKAQASKKAVWYVDDSAPVGGTGLSWSSPVNSFSSGFCNFVACSGDEIRLGQGRYIADPCSINNALTIKGGYAGYGTADPGARDIVAYPTILDGDVTNNGPTTDDKYHVLYFVCHAGSGTVTLDGLTIKGGYSESGGTGAGVYLSGFTLVVRDCTFKENQAAGPGGGLYCLGNWGTHLTIERCVFERNIGTMGGGLYVADPCSVTINNSLFFANIGGGVRVTDSTYTAITACAFRGNVGTAMYVTPEQRNVYTTLRNSLFTGNTLVGGDGAAMHVGGCYPDWTHSVNVSNCTVSLNTTENGAAGGLYVGMNTSVTVWNCILWGNTADANLSQIHNGGGTLTVSHSNVQGGWSGTGNINANPQFVDIDGPDNIPGTEDDDLQLSSGASPCVDAGYNSASSGADDLKGYPRITDGNGDSAVVVDMGAYEYWYDVSPGNSDNDGDGMPDDWELLHDLDPDSYGWDVDSDGDGLIDFGEYVLGGNPWAVDTDQDKFTDFEEYYFFGTEVGQFNGDEDNNGVPDIVEDGTQWGLCIDVCDLEDFAQVERTDIQGHIGVIITVVPWYAQEVAVYIDDQPVGGLDLRWEGKDRWIPVESETFANGWHTVRIVTTDSLGGLVRHRPIKVYFNNLLASVVADDHFDPGEDYTYSAFYAGTGVLEARLTDLDDQVAWSSVYNGPNINIVIPHTVFGVGQFYTLTITETAIPPGQPDGATVTVKQLTKKFEQSNYPNGARMVIVIPDKGIFSSRKAAILACAQACTNRGVTWVSLYHRDVTVANLQYLFQMPEVRYIYWCGHGNNQMRWPNGSTVPRTHTTCWQCTPRSWWFDLWESIPVLSYTTQTFPGVPLLPGQWDTRGFDLWGLGMFQQGNKKIVFIDTCKSAEYDDMAWAYGVFSLQGQGSRDQIYIGWRIDALGVPPGVVGAIHPDNTTTGVRIFWEEMGKGRTIMQALQNTTTHPASNNNTVLALWGNNATLDIGNPNGDDNIFLWGTGDINQIGLNP